MEIETRLLEEWKANNDLLKLYEDLKQKRFSHFLTIQTAFLAFFGLLAKVALGAPSMVSLTALFLSLAAAIHLGWHVAKGFWVMSEEPAPLRRGATTGAAPPAA